MSKHIGGIQQVGIGTSDLKKDWKWYRKHFGMDIRIFEDAAEAPLMIQYTGGEVQKRVAALAMNMQGGGGFEIWQYVSRKPQPADFPITLRERGIIAIKMKTKSASEAYEKLRKNGVNVLTSLGKDPGDSKHFYVADPQGNLFDISEGEEFFKASKSPTAGVYGAVIGVSDMEASLRFYREMLGFDRVLSDDTGVFADYSGLAGSNEKFRRVILGKSEMPLGPFAPLLGTNRVELLQSLEGRGKRIYENRYWGDLGFIHMCFDVQDMSGLKAKGAELGYPFTVDSADSFDMGKAAGRFGYVEDPDGSLIEFVETHKLPIVEKWGWFLNLKKRGDQGKSLPHWLLNCFRFNRVKD